jgi:glycosyltransferase involved in cell wall biosynthesis
VAEATGRDAALLIPPGEARPAVEALSRIATDPELRRRLTDAAAERVRARTLEAEARRVAEFLQARG